MKKTVILLGHKKRVGKDTIANKLKTGLNFVPLSFAAKLKTVVQDLYNFTDEQMHGDAKEVPDERYLNLIEPESGANYLTARRVLQLFAQQQRAIFPRIWAQYIFTQIENSLYNKFVIPDFRFRNEYGTALNWKMSNPENKLITVKIERPSIINTDSDISENDLNTFQAWDFIVVNDGTEDDLYNKFRSQLSLFL